MAYEVMILCHLHMPLYFLGTFTEYPYKREADLKDLPLFLVLMVIFSALILFASLQYHCRTCRNIKFKPLFFLFFI